MFSVYDEFNSSNGMRTHSLDDASDGVGSDC